MLEAKSRVNFSSERRAAKKFVARQSEENAGATEPI
jgi:hypothetical protein